MKTGIGIGIEKLQVLLLLLMPLLCLFWRVMQIIPFCNMYEEREEEEQQSSPPIAP